MLIPIEQVLRQVKVTPQEEGLEFSLPTVYYKKIFDQANQTWYLYGCDPTTLQPLD